MWKYLKDEKFSTKSAYAPFQGQWIWKLDVLPKNFNFLWLCMHNSVPVKNTLASRGIIVESTRPLCKRLPETIVHLLKECIYA